MCTPRRRFVNIVRALHDDGDDKQEEWKGQPQKIGILMRLFAEACFELFVVGKNFAVDEMI